MVGATARITNSQHDILANKPGNTGLLSAWLYNSDKKVSPGCLLADISNGGGSILIPRHQYTPNNSFDLVIMSPDTRGVILTILEAEQRWENKHYSDTHTKIGVEFLNINPVKLRVIAMLIHIIEQRKLLPDVVCD